MEQEEKIKTTKKFEELLPSDFVHLHTHTYHSLLDGLTKIDALVDNVKASGMEAVAITDHGTMRLSFLKRRLRKELSLF